MLTQRSLENVNSGYDFFTLTFLVEWKIGKILWSLAAALGILYKPPFAAMVSG